MRREDQEPVGSLAGLPEIRSCRTATTGREIIGGTSTHGHYNPPQGMCNRMAPNLVPLGRKRAWLGDTVAHWYLLPRAFWPILPLPRIGQIVPLFPVGAVAVLAMDFPMPFGGAVTVPPSAMPAPDQPADHTADPRFVGGKHRPPDLKLLPLKYLGKGSVGVQSCSKIFCTNNPLKLVSPVGRCVDGVDGNFLAADLESLWVTAGLSLAQYPFDELNDFQCGFCVHSRLPIMLERITDSAADDTASVSRTAAAASRPAIPARRVVYTRQVGRDLTNPCGTLPSGANRWRDPWWNGVPDPGKVFAIGKATRLGDGGTLHMEKNDGPLFRVSFALARRLVILTTTLTGGVPLRRHCRGQTGRFRHDP